MSDQNTTPDEGTHRFFAPSSSKRWLFGCSASLVVDTSELVERRRASADRGTRLHAEGHRCLVEGGLASDQFTPPDQASVNAYVEHVRAIPGLKFYEIEADYILGLCGGTSDCVIIHPGGKVLEIVDYKSGSGFVDPVENSQEMIYALSVLKKFRVLGLTDTVEIVRLTIAQPALDNFNSWDTTLEELGEFGARVTAKVEAVMDGDVEFRPSEDDCRFCDARPICPALRQLLKDTAVADFLEGEDGAHGEEKELAREADRVRQDTDTLGDRLRLVPVIKAWCKGVEDLATAKLLKGEEVDGFKVVEGRKGNRAWVGEKEAVAALTGLGFGEMEIFKQTIVSPAQADALAKDRAGKDKEKLAADKAAIAEAWEEGKPGAPVVAPEHDSRPAINKTDLARRDFAEFIEREDD